MKLLHQLFVQNILSSIILLSLLLISSCQNAKLDITTDDMAIKIENSSGDDFSYNSDEGEKFFAPYPFNQGVMKIEDKKYEVVLVSKRIKRGKQVAIAPLAQFTVKHTSGNNEEIIIATPLDTSQQLFKTKDFYEFTVEHFAFKQIIDHWYANKYGLEGTLVENWRPTSLAVLSSQ